jgi:hypothetical protein
MQMSQEAERSVLVALNLAIMDRQVVLIECLEGTACIIPVEDYIRYTEMENTLKSVITLVQERDMGALAHTIEEFSKWLLEGGGERHITIPDGGEEDA